MTKTMLALKNLTKTYPGVVALDNVSLEFETGEIHAIVGENGAGKSTLIKVISGAVAPDSGQILIGEESYSGMTPKQAIEKNISVIYQEFNLFESLTTAENIFIGEKSSGKLVVDYKEMRRRAREIFDRLAVNIDPRLPLKYLSPAQKQIVEIAKAIHKNVKFLIMDEPTAPLTMSEVDSLFNVIKELKENNITIIYISHRLDEIFAIADRVSVLRDGKYIATRTVKDTDRKELISLMVGRDLEGDYPQSTVQSPETVLEAVNLSGNGVHDISFKVKKGEVLGFAGLVGAGRTELMMLIFGAEKKSSGKLIVHGKTVKVTSPAKAMELGIGLIPEDRKLQGVFLQMKIGWNICISNIKKLSKFSVVDREATIKQAEYYTDLLRIKTPSLDQKVVNLSGGNQQKVVLAKVIAAQTEILIFDEPTRGIDIGAREELYHFIRDLSNQGKAVIMVSSDMEELLGMSDRIIVMAEGRITGEISKIEFDQQRVLKLASGE